MSRTHATAIGLLFTVLVARTGNATFAETYVEPWFKDCSGTTIRPQIGGWAVAANADNDGNYEGTGNEDTDGDDIFTTIQTAINNTTAGGIVTIMIPGIYREQLTVPDSITIRGRKDGDVLLDGSCLGSSTKAFDLTGSSKTIVLENISIHGYGFGVFFTNSNTLTMSNCRIRACGVGITSGGSGAAGVNFFRGEITNCETAIAGSGSVRVQQSIIADNTSTAGAIALSGTPLILSLTDTHVVRNAGVGVNIVSSSGSCQFDVHGSEISANGDRGIYYDSTSTGTFRLTDSIVQGNGGDGVFVNNLAGCVSSSTPPLNGVVAHCRIMGNVGDGIEVKGSGTGCTGLQVASQAKISVFQNTVALNGAYGLNGNTSGSFACTLGQNQISYNVSGPENGTAVCTAAGTSSNSVP